MPILKALRPLIHGTIEPLRLGQRDYQTWPGQLFEVDEETALDLESRGLAERHYERPAIDVSALLAKMQRPEAPVSMPLENKMLAIEEDKTAVAVAGRSPEPVRPPVAPRRRRR